MDLEILNPHVMKIIIAARKVDSINKLASRINLSYGWTHKWVSELTKIGVFKATRMKLFLQTNNEHYKRILNFIREYFLHDINFYYTVIDLFGIPYCFTEIDSVFIWTKGGYNIARHKGHYPIFLKIRKADQDIFRYYMEKFDQKEVYYEVIWVDSIKCEKVNDIPVDSIDDTINYMKRYIYNFQPALEMVEKMYGIKTGVKYQEVSTNV